MASSTPVRSAPSTFLKRKGARGNFRFYRRVPQDVVSAIGRGFWEKSLRTSDEQMALRLVRPLVVETDQLIDAARKVASLGELIESLPAADRREIRDAGGLDAFKAELHEQVQRFRILDTAAAWTVVDDAHALPEQIADRGWKAEALIDHAGTTAEREEVRRQIADGQRLLVKLGQRLSSAEAIVRERDPGLNEALKLWVSENRPPEQSARQYAYAIRRFVELHGDLPLRQIEKRHLREFGEAIQGLPVSTRADVARLEIRDATARAARDGLPTISAQTRTKHLQAIRAMMRFAVAQGLVLIDPFEGFRITSERRKASKRAEAARLPFETAELTAIIAALAKRYGRGHDSFWIPVFAMHQGARLEEICQLRSADILEIDGIWSARITDEGEGQRLKNYASMRTIPLHQGLISAGFVAHVRASRNEMAFPSLNRDRRGRLGGPYGKRFSSFLRKTVGIADPRKTFHSFRHTWTDAARAAGVPYEIRARLAGRETREIGSEKGYGTGYAIAQMSASLDSIQFPKLMRDIEG